MQIRKKPSTFAKGTEVRWPDWAAGDHVIWLWVRCAFTADCWQTCGSLSGAKSRKQQQMRPGRRDYANRANSVCFSNTRQSERGLTVCYNKQTKKQRIRSNGWSVWEACLFTLACLIDRWRGAEVLESLAEFRLQFQFCVYSLLWCFLTLAEMQIESLDRAEILRIVCVQVWGWQLSGIHMNQTEDKH